MKKQLLLGVALGALAVATSAMAADLPVKAPVYKAPVVAPYNWTGWYAGANIGYSWGRARGDFDEPTFAALGFPNPFSVSLRPDGLIGGAQLGYNWQNDNKWVFGLEADFQGSGEKDSAARDPFTFTLPQVEGTTFTINQTFDAKIKWFGTLRARAGVLLTPTVLLYGTGGLAYGNIDLSSTVSLTIAVPGLSATTSSSFGESKTRLGWTLGAGIEGAIPNTRDWTWKAEYLYIDFGSISGAGTDPTIGAYSWSTKVTDNIARIGVNYRFSH